MIGVRQNPDAFAFDFQVTDTEYLRQKPNRMMLSIVSSSTKKISNPSYQVVQSVPDACIHSHDTAILIEAKTQSPLVEEQIESHIRQYLGTATRNKVVTWEDIIEKLRMLSKASQRDRPFPGKPVLRISGIHRAGRV